MSLEIELEIEIKRQLQDGIKLARAGDKAAAATVFGRILEASPDNEDALVWKAAVTNNRREAVRCLEKALQLNPNNKRAQAGLEWAQRRLEDNQLEETEELPAAPPASSPTPPPAGPPPLRLVPPFEPKSETKVESAPYKKSRFANQAPAPALPPEALPQKPPRPERIKKGRPRFSPRRSPRMEEDGLINKATPKIAFTVSENVMFGERTGTRQTYTVRVIWPLLLFVLALALALLTFLISALAPLLGMVALLVAGGGVILFNRAEF